MPNKTIFLPSEAYPYVSEVNGYQQTIDKLEVLEISTRSKDPFGKGLNPFNLQITLKSGKKARVECLYQGSKVIEGGQQYQDLYWGSPRDAALDRRVKGKPPIGFRFFNRNFPTEPKHSFFNYLYIVSLIQRRDDVFEKLSLYDGFSDIYYSLKKDLNSQARAASIYVSLVRQGLISSETPSDELWEILTGG